jgi:predicted RNA-binding Zn-ribbon protein involved in translation (DUF1610 family)
MPINMACPSCGKTLAAPDGAGGKQAKCPGCAQMMIVPAAAGQADAPDAPAPPVGDDLLDELAGPRRAADDVASSPENVARRPCPECGEMIAASAGRCRFCGAVFDPRLLGSHRHFGKGQSYNGFAVTSMVTGIVAVPGLCVYAWPGILLGIIAIVFGNVALKGMAKSGNDQGRGMAVAGLVLGIVVSAVAVLIVVIAVAAFMMLMSRHF